MKKLGLLLCATGAMVLAGCGAIASQLKDLPERDARVIVEVNKKLNKLNANETKKPCNIPEALSPFESSENTAVICGSEKKSYKELIA